MSDPIRMLLWCPQCHERHYDVGEFETRPHHTHACQHCGMVWRPAVENTIGVKFLPGFKNEAGAPARSRSQSVEIQRAGGPMSVECPTCHAKPGQPCAQGYGKTTMGDYGPDFHDTRRPTCGLVHIEGGIEKQCSLPAGHDSSRHQ